MNENIQNSVQFGKISLSNYGIFQNTTEFLFDRHRTFIVGSPGAGKTTIFNALANLGPVLGVQPNFHSKSSEMSVNVLVDGNQELVRDYSNLIFVDDESTHPDPAEKFLNEIDESARDAIENMARPIFQALVARKPWKIEAHRDLKASGMATGEKVCLNYSYIFAFREYLGLVLPIVIDRPFSMLDTGLSVGVDEFLRQKDCQQIFFLGESEYERVMQEDGTHYKMDRPQ